MPAQPREFCAEHMQSFLATAALVESTEDLAWVHQKGCEHEGEEPCSNKPTRRVRFSDPIEEEPIAPAEEASRPAILAVVEQEPQYEWSPATFRTIDGGIAEEGAGLNP